jgi:hypothetical protein
MRKLIAVTLFLCGCSSGPKYKIDDNSLASIPLAEKQGMLAAQNEQNVAKEELRQTKADLDNNEREVDVAVNEYKTAKLSLDTAELNKKAADSSGDMNRKNTASRELHVAEVGVKATDAKVSWLEKKRKYIKALRDAAEKHVEVADAKYELEKAKLASAKGMRPSDDFNIMNFETETMEKQNKWSQERLDADKRQPDVLDLERKWKALDDQWQAAKRQP